jgi:hypothetical protein
MKVPPPLRNLPKCLRLHRNLCLIRKPYSTAEQPFSWTSQRKSCPQQTMSWSGLIGSELHEMPARERQLFQSHKLERYVLFICACWSTICRSAHCSPSLVPNQGEGEAESNWTVKMTVRTEDEVSSVRTKHLQWINSPNPELAMETLRWTYLQGTHPT